METIKENPESHSGEIIRTRLNENYDLVVHKYLEDPEESEGNAVFKDEVYMILENQKTKEEIDLNGFIEYLQGEEGANSHLNFNESMIRA